MLDVLNVVGTILQVGVMVIQPQVVVLADGNIPLMSNMTEVRPAVFRMVRDPDSKACRLKGVLLAYERDWEEVIETQSESGLERRVIPAAPGEIEGYAVVLHERVCPDKPAQAVAFVTDYNGGLFKTRLVDGLRRDATNLATANDFNRPKWLPQVAAKLEGLGYHSAALAARTEAVITEEPKD